MDDKEEKMEGKRREKKKGREKESKLAGNTVKHYVHIFKHLLAHWIKIKANKMSP